jgi:hypothetical protein
LKSKKWDVFCVFPEQFRKTVDEMGISFKGLTRISETFSILLHAVDSGKFWPIYQENL